MMYTKRKGNVFVFVLLSAAVLRFCMTYQKITLNTLFSPQDPFGGFTIFPHCSAHQSCEFVTPEATILKDDKVKVVLMGCKPARRNNYLQLFKRYTAMRDTVEHEVFIWNNLETDPPPVPRGCISSAPAATI